MCQRGEDEGTRNEVRKLLADVAVGKGDKLANIVKLKKWFDDEYDRQLTLLDSE